MKMIPILIISFLITILLLSSVYASEYTGNSKTDCEVVKVGLMRCTSKISVNPYEYVIEDNVWKHFSQARSLKDKGYYVSIDLDRNYPVKVLDFNSTSVIVDFGITATSLDKNIPIVTLTEDDLSVSSTTIKFTNLEDIRRTIPISFNTKIRYGDKSTIIRIQGVNITEDGYVTSSGNRYNTSTYMYIGLENEVMIIDRSYIQFNTSIINNQFSINSVSLNISQQSGTGFPDDSCSIKPIERSVDLWSNAGLYADIGNGTAYNSTMNCSYYFTGYQNIQLGSSGVTAINSSQDTDWFAVGIQGNNEGSPTFPKWLLTSESSNSPQLILEYFLYDFINPEIFFTNPTPENNLITEDFSHTFNFTVYEENLGVCIFNFNNSNFTAYNSSLVAMYNFENRSSLGENSNLVVDLASDTQNNGTISGAVLTSGVYGNGLFFDGINDNVALSTTGLPSGNSPRTIEFWFNAKEFKTATERTMLTYGTSANGQVIGFVAEDNAVAPFFYGNRWISPKTELSTDTWYHIAFVIKQGATTTDSTNWTLYINGVEQVVTLEAGSVYNLNTGLTAFRLGSSQADTLFYNGSLDEVRIWNYARTSEEINQSMNSYLTKINNSYWTFNRDYTLDYGTYTYYAYAMDLLNNFNSTELRYLYIQDIYNSPTFLYPYNPKVPYLEFGKDLDFINIPLIKFNQSI